MLDSVFLTTYILAKVSENAYQIWIFFFREGKTKIQEMIYQEQLHYKSQRCTVSAGDFL